MFTKQFVQAQILSTEKGEELVEKLRQEDGEIASQIIVMAMLVAVAVVLKGAQGPLTTLANSIVTGVN